mmetsp:Transcript_27684/g.55952  ORF Transcript_27684/g.55952 Transcript_27684/m.55952 type:complete len:216 (+) Transcript_27684:81-728(+)
MHIDPSKATSIIASFSPNAIGLSIDLTGRGLQGADGIIIQLSALSTTTSGSGKRRIRLRRRSRRWRRRRGRGVRSTRRHPGRLEYHIVRTRQRQIGIGRGGRRWWWSTSTSTATKGCSQTGLHPLKDATLRTTTTVHGRILIPHLIHGSLGLGNLLLKLGLLPRLLLPQLSHLLLLLLLSFELVHVDKDPSRLVLESAGLLVADALRLTYLCREP